MENHILKRRQEICSNICSTFEKAKANIGEIRIWGGEKYKKVNAGEWVKLVDSKGIEKEKTIAPSGINKVLKEELNEKELDFKRKEENFEKEWTSKNGFGLAGIILKVSLSRAKEASEEFNLIAKEYFSLRKDLTDESNEVKELIEKRQKEKRQKESGKIEIDLDDNLFKDLFKDITSITRKYSELPVSVSAKVALGLKVNADDYWLSTSTSFMNLFSYDSFESKTDEKGEWVDPIELEWEKLKKENPKLEHTHSPKSTSEYLVDREKGLVYRMADHWGRCASCYWDFQGTHSYGIGVSKLSDFERNDNGYGFLNPELTPLLISSSKTIFRKVNKVLENEKVYLTKPCLNKLKVIIDSVSRDLRYKINLNIEEIDKIKKQYSKVFLI